MSGTFREAGVSEMIRLGSQLLDVNERLSSVRITPRVRSQNDRGTYDSQCAAIRRMA